LYEAARARGLPRVMDADTGNPKAIRELMRLANHVIFSEGGLSEVAGTPVGDDAAAALSRVAAHIDGVAGVTLGERGSLFIIDGELCRFSAPVVQVVDSNGAGDVFHGAYAAAIVRGESPPQAVRYASAAAALKCSREAGWNNLPRQEEVLAFMKEHPCQS
jgi:sulfofructose kinase